MLKQRLLIGISSCLITLSGCHDKNDSIMMNQDKDNTDTTQTDSATIILFEDPNNPGAFLINDSLKK